MSVDNKEFLIAPLSVDFFSALYGVWFDRCLERTWERRTEHRPMNLPRNHTPIMIGGFGLNSQTHFMWSSWDPDSSKSGAVGAISKWNTHLLQTALTKARKRILVSEQSENTQNFPRLRRFHEKQPKKCSKCTQKPLDFFSQLCLRLIN